MPKVRVAGFGVSLDGFSAGTEQSLSDPLGKRGPEIFKWFFHTKTFCAMHGQEGGSVDVDDVFARRSMENFGAFILGRNMFGPVRGPWQDDSWKGWWGDNPPYHAPTFVLTHYEREPLVMEGGTTFYFITGGIEEALRRAKQVAGDKDVKIGGGVSTVRQYLQAGLIDSLHLALTPVVLGQGEALFTGLDLPALGFSVTERKVTEHATHVVLEKGQKRTDAETVAGSTPDSGTVEGDWMLRGSHQSRMSTCDRFEPIGAGGFPFAMERGSWIPAATVLPWRTGARYHAVAEEGVPLREIADVIGQGLNVPVVAKSPEEAPDHFGWLAAFIGLDCPASSAQTQERLGWSPKGPGLIPDLARHFEA